MWKYDSNLIDQSINQSISHWSNVAKNWYKSLFCLNIFGWLKTENPFWSCLDLLLLVVYSFLILEQDSLTIFVFSLFSVNLWLVDNNLISYKGMEINPDEPMKKIIHYEWCDSFHSGHFGRACREKIFFRHQWKGCKSHVSFCLVK
mgnify:CR=1 FL=1